RPDVRSGRPAAAGRHPPALPGGNMTAADHERAVPRSAGDDERDVLLSADGLSVRREKREVVHGVSLALRRGELVALLGPNGAGKSTLLDALAGALEPAEGRVERHGRVGVALQSPDLARRTV